MPNAFTNAAWRDGGVLLRDAGKPFFCFGGSPLCATCGDRGWLADGAVCPDCAEEARAG